MADDFNNAILRDISMVKGDSMCFGFQIQGLGDIRPDGIFFACKEALDDDTYIFNKTLEDGIELRSYDSDEDILTYGVRVAPEDTEDVDLGRYFYDLSIHVESDVLTLMKGRIEITWEVNENANS